MASSEKLWLFNSYPYCHFVSSPYRGVNVVIILQRGSVNQNLSQGHLSLSGFQLRGHAMFSGLDRPPDCETLEYAWLIEIQLGILTGRLTMPQVHCVM